jgi:hypothetical protein
LEGAVAALGLVVRDTPYEVDVVVKDGTLDDEVLTVGRREGVVVTTGSSVDVDVVETAEGVVTGGSVVIGPAAVAGGTLNGEAADTVVTETAGEAEVTAGDLVVTADEAVVTTGDSVITDGDSMSTADRSPLMRVAAGPRRCSGGGCGTSGPEAAEPEVTSGAAEPEVTPGAAEPEVTSGAAEPEVTSGAAEPEVTSGAARRCLVESDVCSTWS